jgi:hypothetical protein
LILQKGTTLAVDLTLQPARLETTLLQRAILQTLAYADIFDYPLTAAEVHRYLINVNASFDEVSKALEHMDKTVSKAESYFVLAGREEIVETRARRKSDSKRLWKYANFYGRIIALLPFVRMVAVTGSLAMANIEDGGDIDYFIVTAQERLWTCRAMCLLVVRTARLAGLNLCPNYFVSEDALSLDHPSLYAAHELAQMIPLYGKDIYDEMRRMNRWSDGYLPNAQGAPRRSREVKPFIGKRLFESVFARLPFQGFEVWEMKRKIAKLGRGQNQNPEAVFSAQVCKGHVDRHGQRVEEALAKRFAKLAIGLDQ